jgi:hypothetical protein
VLSKLRFPVEVRHSDAVNVRFRPIAQMSALFVLALDF